MRKFTILAFAFALSACGLNTGTAPATNYAAIVGMIQTNYPTLEAVLALVQPNNAGIQAAEGKITPIVAALSATSAPNTISAAVADIAALLPSVPTCAAGVTKQDTCLTTQTKGDITLALSLLTTVSTLAPLL
jgi:hypothetical protein